MGQTRAQIFENMVRIVLTFSLLLICLKIEISLTCEISCNDNFFKIIDLQAKSLQHAGQLRKCLQSQITANIKNLSHVFRRTKVFTVDDLSSDDNAADKPTRVNSTHTDILPDSTWQRGPLYLYTLTSSWPIDRDFALRKEACTSENEINKAISWHYKQYNS